jgi:ankyrin repeat protein
MTGEPHPPSGRKPLPSAFLEAVRTGNVEAVRQMLADGYSDLNYAEPSTGLTALHYAAARNARAILKLLVATGKCDFARKDRQGRTAATLAVEVADNPAIGRYLYDRLHRQQPHAQPAGDAQRAQKTPRRGTQAS